MYVTGLASFNLAQCTTVEITVSHCLCYLRILWDMALCESVFPKIKSVKSINVLTFQDSTANTGLLLYMQYRIVSLYLAPEIQYILIQLLYSGDSFCLLINIHTARIIPNPHGKTSDRHLNKANKTCKDYISLWSSAA